MSSLFRDALHEDFGTWPIAYIPYGGVDFGEIQAVAEAKGHTASARALYLRARSRTVSGTLS